MGEIKKPPFTYYGGKQRLASKIVKLLPPHTVYVEPFCGSAAVMFCKGIPPGNNAYYREVINDTNQQVINFFRVLQHPELAEKLIYRLSYTLHSKEEYLLACQITKSPIMDMVESAWAFFCNIQMSFAKGMNKGWGFSVVSKNDAISFFNKRKSLASFSARFQSVYIESTDAIECVKKWDSPQTCFYIDPPYPNTEQGHYDGFTQDDFIKLIETVQNIQGSAVLSCYDNPAIPSDWVKHEFEARMSASNGKHRQTDEISRRIECVWIKPAIEEPRPVLVQPMAKNKSWIDNNADRQLNWIDMLEAMELPLCLK